jgi:hypothetical protein
MAAEAGAKAANANGGWGPIKPSQSAMRTINPIRGALEKLKPPNMADKPHIPLSIGKPYPCKTILSFYT